MRELLFHALHEVIMETANFIVSKYNELFAIVFLFGSTQLFNRQPHGVETHSFASQCIAMFSLSWLKSGVGLFNAENKSDLFSLGNQQWKYI